MPAGVMMPFAGEVAPEGWVLCSGRTIGNASSAATQRANADCQDLFTQLWTAYTDASLPVETSIGTASTRGASASADWTAGKRITLPDMRGRVAVGLDNMGGSAANQITTTGAGIDGTALGALGGSQTCTLTVAQIPPHTHSCYIDLFTSAASIQNGTGRTSMQSASTGSTGGGSAHQNTQPSLMTAYIIKL